MVHSNGCTNRNFRNFGLNGKGPLNYWKCVSNFPSPDWHYWRWLFELFNHGAFSILVNTLRPRTLFRHCFADGLNQKFISVCGSSCRVVRCQVLRIQWNFKSLERKKVFVISKSVVLKGWSQEETDKASSQSSSPRIKAWEWTGCKSLFPRRPPFCPSNVIRWLSWKRLEVMTSTLHRGRSRENALFRRWLLR